MTQKSSVSLSLSRLLEGGDATRLPEEKRGGGDILSLRKKMGYERDVASQLVLFGGTSLHEIMSGRKDHSRLSP